MDDLLTLQDLIDALARRHDMEQEDADAFVRMFFKLIEEGLELDKYVKVKGFGTFKLIEMQGGARISFTPDTTMRELVNKPFAHFETVVLNEDTHFDDMKEENVSVLSSEMEESMSEEEESSQLQEAVKETCEVRAPEQIITEKQEVAEESGEAGRDWKVQPEEADVPEDVDVPGELHKECAMPDAAPEPLAANGCATSVAPKKKGRGFPWCMLASILLVGVFVGGGMVWNFFSHKRYVSDRLLDSLIYSRLHSTVLIEQHEKARTPTVHALPSVSDSATSAGVNLPENDTTATVGGSKSRPEVRLPELNVPDKSSAGKVSKKAAETGTPKTAVRKETLSDTVEYQITGSQGSYTLKSGESLVKVAQKFYGNKRLWPYLVKHNRKRIKNPDKVPVGTTIEIPVLTPKR